MLKLDIAGFMQKPGAENTELTDVSQDNCLLHKPFIETIMEKLYVSIQIKYFLFFFTCILISEFIAIWNKHMAYIHWHFSLLFK